MTCIKYLKKGYILLPIGMTLDCIWRFHNITVNRIVSGPVNVILFGVIIVVSEINEWDLEGMSCRKPIQIKRQTTIHL